MSLHRRLPLLGLIVMLSACNAPLTPEAQCFADATVAYRAAWRGAAAIRADLARGYALHVQEIKVAEAVPCRVGGARSTCLGNGRRRLTTPIAIDRADLEARLAHLDAKMAALRPAARRAAAPCGYEGGSARAE